MHKLSMRRFLPVIALPALLLFAAPSALGTPRSLTEKIHAIQSGKRHGLHQKADVVSGRKADSKSGKKTDSKSSRKGHGKSHKKAASKSAATKTAAALSATPIPATILLGNSAVQSRQGYLSAERSAAFRFRAEAAGTAGSARVYISPSNAAGIVIVGVYSNANGQPGSLLSVGSLLSPAVGAWNSVALTASSITSGQSYLARDPRRGRHAALQRVPTELLPERDQRPGQPRRPTGDLELWQGPRELPDLGLRDRRRIDPDPAGRNSAR